jgi:hypothetical protein
MDWLLLLLLLELSPARENKLLAWVFTEPPDDEPPPPPDEAIPPPAP